MDQSSITPNTSNQQLVINGDNDSATALLHEKQSRRRDTLSDVTFKEYMTVGILCFVNLINYMDRFTLAGVLDDVKTEFGIGDDKAGLLQTVFVIAYMVFAPIFGYLGDRYSRRLIMAFGVALWCLTTFAGSFIQSFVPFTIFRGLVGIGEASYSTIAPTIISDLFVGNVRSKMLAFFYFAIPVGSGFGYIVGSVVGAAANNWRWGLRVTPFLGLAAVALILWVMENPERGQAEESRMKPTSYQEDLRSLVRNPSFMLSTLAFTCVAFVTGALAWWGPQFIYLGLTLQARGVTQERVSFIFGALTMASGVVGVPLGAWLGAALVKRWGRAHAVICGVGLLLSTPAMALAMLLTDVNPYAPFALMFFGEVALNLNWAIVADMSLYVVIPPRRSTAEAFQILISHMFGDAGSPYLVGVISESLKRSAPQPASLSVQFRSLQRALFITCFVEVLGGIFFLLTAIYIVRDKQKVDRAIAAYGIFELL
ncbi:protein spinster isoform X4 [Maniola hyperantus]|uniref:protein spinster isoform X4 n=1 Tax=Aphantopus hyperantus TaxID=2795564 RepID=UPI001567D9A7|nr:protein spinster isoform X4 [Maniola hyperantus]XP_034831765.1 protein spinster isoform X4 [Maniola hyperantus]